LRAPAAFAAVPLPPPVLEHFRNEVLGVDFIFIQGHVFLHNISRDIQFRTVSAVPDRKHSTMVKELKSIIRLYACRGFSVRDFHADNEFACIRDDIHPIHLNVVAADSHVVDIERSIRTERNASVPPSMASLSNVSPKL
jgi:hypothetical protein